MKQRKDLSIDEIRLLLTDRWVSSSSLSIFINRFPREKKKKLQFSQFSFDVNNLLVLFVPVFIDPTLKYATVSKSICVITMRFIWKERKRRRSKKKKKWRIKVTLALPSVSLLFPLIFKSPFDIIRSYRRHVSRNRI